MAGGKVRAEGRAIALPCHFGEWLQGRIGPQGPVALVTLWPEGWGMTGRCLPGPLTACRFGAGQGRIAAPVLARFLRDLGLPATGRYLLRPRFAPGLGTGMSTAALIAVARLAGFRGSAEALARACLAAEGASDPLMFAAPDRMLWASRQARVLSPLPAVPRAHLLAGFWGPALPTRANDDDYPDISDLLPAWAAAPGLAGCAAIARESARRCLARRGPADDPTEALARDLGALGWAMSHSGAARALIFAPGGIPDHGADVLHSAGLRGICRLRTGTI